MKNKSILSIFLAIFCLSLIGNVLSEEIYFETPEILAFENGNLLKALKGGKALTDTKVEIIADEFEYNKVTNILEATGNVKIDDQKNKIILYGKKVIYNKNEEKFRSIDAEAITADNMKIIADEIEYNKITNILVAIGNVKIDDPKKQFVLYGEKSRHDRSVML